MRGSYYEVLGIAPLADEGEIRARYLHLMRRYHPDVNRSPLAHVRATQISEAFRMLSDPVSRARHDAELASRRADVVNAQVVNLTRIAKHRALAVQRRPSLASRYGAWAALAILLVGTALAGQRIERHLAASGSGLVSFLQSDDDGAGEARRAIEALNAATRGEVQAMPPISPVAIGRGVAAFRQIMIDNNPAAIRAFSEQCHAEADAGSWDMLDACVAFDHAAFLESGPDAMIQAADYFIERHDRAAHLYLARVSSFDAIRSRLEQIRSEVLRQRERRSQVRAVAMSNDPAQERWLVAGAAPAVPDLPDGEPRAGDHSPADF